MKHIYNTQPHLREKGEGAVTQYSFPTWLPPLHTCRGLIASTAWAYSLWVSEVKGGNLGSLWSAECSTGDKTKSAFHWEGRQWYGGEWIEVVEAGGRETSWGAAPMAQVGSWQWLHPGANRGLGKEPRRNSVLKPWGASEHPQGLLKSRLVPPRSRQCLIH